MKPVQAEISVVVPLYNKENYIERAVNSVLSQGKAIREVIVVDDGSTDNSPNRLDNLSDARIRLIRQRNSGSSAARNTGLEAATSEYVAFLDADDVWLPGFVNELLALMVQFPEAATYATSYSRVWPDGRRQDAHLPKGLAGSERQLLQDPFEAWSRSSFFSISSSACIRRSLLNQHEIRFPIGEKLGEDQDVIFRLMESGSIAFSSKVLMEYSQAVPNSAYSSLPDTVLPCYVRLLHRSQQVAYPAQHRRGARRVVSVSYLNTAHMLIRKGRRSEAAKLIFSRMAMNGSAHWVKTVLRLVLPRAKAKS